MESVGKLFRHDFLGENGLAIARRRTTPFVHEESGMKPKCGEFSGTTRIIGPHLLDQLDGCLIDLGPSSLGSGNPAPIDTE